MMQYNLITLLPKFRVGGHSFVGLENFQVLNKNGIVVESAIPFQFIIAFFYRYG
jgi:hypothetical protein